MDRERCFFRGGSIGSRARWAERAAHELNKVVQVWVAIWEQPPSEWFIVAGSELEASVKRQEQRGTV